MDKKITLKAARINIGLTQVDAAEKLGVTKDTLSRWESGKTSPSVKKFKVIEEVYGVSYNRINFLP